MNKIIVVDYGMGNLRSVAQALKTVAPDADIKISGGVADIVEADRIVLPGQGAMPDCMQSLKESGVQDAVIRAVETKPLLGICVGEQMLFDWSEEGNTSGLGLLPGKVARFDLEGRLQEDGSRFKVPQMGWNQVHQKMAHPLWTGIDDQAYFYFVHSYFVVPEKAEHVAGETIYGDAFCCAVARDNVFATQFHPEKSASAGLQLYKNFVHWNP